MIQAGNDRTYPTAICTIGILAGWIAIALQFDLVIVNRRGPAAEAIYRFFAYYTILTNILVAYCFSVLLPRKRQRSSLGEFFARPSTLTAITAYICMVGIVYNAMLRNLWMPRGLQRIVDEVLHLFIPLFFLVFWMLFVPKDSLNWRDVPRWLIYPFLYMVFVLVSGAFSGFYPYPFIDVSDLGYPKTLVNCLVMLILFLVLSFGLVAVGKLWSRSAPPSKS
jgi:hypothetical protein